MTVAGFGWHAQTTVAHAPLSVNGFLLTVFRSGKTESVRSFHFMQNNCGVIRLAYIGPPATSLVSTRGRKLRTRQSFFLYRH